MGDDASMFASLCSCCAGDSGEPLVVIRKERHRSNDERTSLLRVCDLGQTPNPIHNDTCEISIQQSTSAKDRPPFPDRIAQSSPSWSDSESITEVVKYNRLYYEVMA